MADTGPELLEHTRLMNTGAARKSVPNELEIPLEQDCDVRTPFGPMRVSIRGDIRLPALFTYHDIGLNSVSCFQGFFNYPDMQSLTRSFCVFHLNALGQQEGAPALPNGLGQIELPTGDNYVYPTMDQLASMILCVTDYFKLRSFVGFGVGAGANVLARFALVHPEKVDGLMLVNGNASKSGWVEWGYQKWNAWYLKSGMLTQGVQDYLLWHWFGNKTLEDNHDLVSIYSEYIHHINPTNLGHFVATYIGRSDLGIMRELDKTKKFGVKNFKCPVMLVAGQESAHLDDTIEMNGRLDPSNSTWMKLDCGGMVLEEAPGKLCQSMRLFLQGLGYAPSLKAPLEHKSAPDTPMTPLHNLP